MNSRINGHGFTLVEVMIVCAIIGVVAAIAIPNFANTRKTAAANACKANLRQLNGAVITYAANNGHNPDNLNLLVPDYLKTMPKCPLGDSYNYDTETGNVTCPRTAEGHTLN